MAVHQESKKKEESAKKEKKRFQSKVVVRRLPADMTEAQFLEQVAPLPAHSYLSLQAPLPGAGAKQLAGACAHIDFCALEDLLTFRQRFDGYVFVSQSGEEHTAIVEYAINQRVPRMRSRRPDAKCATLHGDNDFLTFVAQLERDQQQQQQQQQSSDGSAIWEQTLKLIEEQEKQRKDAPRKSTPLVSYLCQKRLDRVKGRRKVDTAARSDVKLAVRQREVVGVGDAGRQASGEGRGAQRGASAGSSKARSRRGDADAARSQSGRGQRTASQAHAPVDRPAEAAQEAGGGGGGKGSRRARAGEARGDSGARASRSHRSQPPVASQSSAVRADTGETPSESMSARTGESVDTAAASTIARKAQHDKQLDRKVRNKDRPSIAIYRPGMGKYSSRRMQECDSGAPCAAAAADDGVGSTASCAAATTTVRQPDAGSCCDDSRRHSSRARPHKTMVFRRRRRSHDRAGGGGGGH